MKRSRPTAFQLYAIPLLVIALGQTIRALVAGWREGFPDFTIFYASAVALRHGQDPYAVPATLGLGPNSNPP